ncbi:bifunctional metallophosphatase/5'-nucleotidase [Lentiprolixibacter aurantiacus]|uniref:Metallophosphatase n=1 Tax=Lentiprolixibacter aurantiacus TaxID=2993939 RepID=A0AAE3ML16_9FLAO|nr:metallophosphatase [Lentiprolixibacter aurantiacus]MCX2719374.1 metallophosphatase [Lentiprolixibacter aurantiacus]
MDRREFVGKAAAGSALLASGGLGLGSCSRNQEKHITILHTNDVHSHIDPFPSDHSRNPNMGGVPRRAALVEQIRRENPNTLLLDAGDIFQGTPYFNFYGGELEFRLMSKMRYDMATIGNHDFDNGIDGLLAQMPYADFELISANYDFSNTVMHGLVKPYSTRVIDGIKIGVFGLGISLQGLVLQELYKETIYLNPVEIAQDMSRILREEEGCQLVIALSHLGHEYRNPDRPSDVLLASQTEGIDLIIGGHTHTFLERPVIRPNRRDQPVMINQVGCYGLYLGRIDFHFSSKKIKNAQGVSITV